MGELRNDLELQGGHDLCEFGYLRHTLDVQKVVKTEFKTNGQTLSSTNRGSQLAGAAIGALALGGVGAIIGGLSGKSSQKQIVNSISVTLTVDLDHKMIWNLEFYDLAGWPDGLPAEHRLIEPIIERAQDFAARVEKLMRDAANTMTPISDKTGQVDELARLWELHEKGALTREEFEAAKIKVLQ